jgi:hypothetical protein
MPILTNMDEVHDEIRGTINSENTMAYQSVKKLLSSHLLSTTLKVRVL